MLLLSGDEYWDINRGFTSHSVQCIHIVYCLLGMIPAMLIRCIEKLLRKWKRQTAGGGVEVRRVYTQKRKKRKENCHRASPFVKNISCAGACENCAQEPKGMKKVGL